jgi:translation initiation factor IF-2
MAKEKEQKPIGEVTHYYNNLGVAIVKFNKKVKAGETVHFKGATTDFTQKLDSIQYDHKDVDGAAKGKEVGIKVDDRVRQGDELFEVA